MLGILRRFPNYTYSTLMQEDTAFLRLLAIEAAGTPDEADTVEGGETGWPATM
ncbi:hypothetical protein OG235_28085 [Streptomyces sp. NBC_00024]|uniref:hypothetical protein n=1 Tax=Streptomyces sp. NBC_00024 TaxID=2903612 RepID=UPI00324B3F09